jgi:hypothetical protein
VLTIVLTEDMPVQVEFALPELGSVLHFTLNFILPPTRPRLPRLHLRFSRPLRLRGTLDGGPPLGRPPLCAIRLPCARPYAWV